MKGLSHKECKTCRVIKPLDCFPYSTSAHQRRRTICKDCARARKQTDEYRRTDRNRTRNKRNTQPEYRQKQIDQSRSYGQTTRGRAMRLYHAAKHRAKTSGVMFDICVAHIEVLLLTGVCQRTGIPFDFSRPDEGLNFNPYAPSVDKKDPFGGYTAANIQIVCNAYNLAKNQFTDEQFVAFCKLVVGRHGE